MSPASTPHFDLEQCEAILGDKELVMMMLKRFSSELQEKRAAVTSAAQSKDFKAMRDAAHSLKGAASYVAAPHIQDACGKIQNAFDAGQQASLPALGVEFETVMDAAAKELTRLVG